MKTPLLGRVFSELLGLNSVRTNRLVPPMSWHGHPLWRRLLAGLVDVDLAPCSQGQLGRSTSREWPKFPRVPRRVLIAVLGVGLTLGCVLLSSNASILAALTISIIIGGLAVAVDYVVEVRAALRGVESDSRVSIEEIAERLFIENEAVVRQVEKAHARLFERIDDRIGLLMSVPELFSLQRKRPSTAQSMVKVVRDAYSFERQASPLSAKFLEKKTTDFASLLRGLRAGYATYNGEDFDWLMTLTGTSERSIDATSSTAAFWNSNQGLLYLEAQREAVEERRVRVRRLFILEFARLADDPFFAELCDRQQRAGFDIRYLARDGVRPELLNQLDDFVIFDNELSYETVPTPPTTPGDDRPTVSRTEIVVDRDLVGQRVRQFSTLWDAALPVSEREGNGHDGTA